MTVFWSVITAYAKANHSTLRSGDPYFLTIYTGVIYGFRF